MSYQVRISYETAILIEELKNIYENIEKSPITKGEVLIRSYYDAQWVKNWKEIYTTKIKVSNKYEIKENALRPRLQITEEVEQGIKDLKIKTANELSLKNVTIGVVIRLILKASLIKNTNKKIETEPNNLILISTIFNKYKENVSINFEEIQRNEFLILLNNLEKEIKKSLK